MSLIKIDTISKIYQQGDLEVTALKDLSLEVDQGEFTAIVGPSGSGKTTLLNILGLLDTPSRGEVRIREDRVDQLSGSAASDYRLRNIGFVFQAYNLIPVFTARENIEYVLQMQGMEKEPRRERSLEILKEMNMSDLANRFPRELSGGQQQRVAVARALVSEPAVVLADEPTANLDTQNANLLLDIMEALANRHKITFLFSTHDNRVMERARRIVHLRDGQIQEDARQS